MPISNEIQLLKSILSAVKELFVELGGEIGEGDVPIVVEDPLEGDILQYAEYDKKWYNRRRDIIQDVGEDYVKTVWFTSQMITVDSGTYFRATFEYTMSDPNNMSITSKVEGEYDYPNLWLTDPFTDSQILPSGKVTIFLPYDTSTSISKEKFKVEVYLVNPDGSLKPNIDYGNPVGTLGVQPVVIFHSTDYSNDKDTKIVIAVDSNLNSDANLVLGERLLIKFIGKITGGDPNKNKSIRLFFGGINNEMYMQTTHVMQMIEDINKLAGDKVISDGATIVYSEKMGGWGVYNINELKNKKPKVPKKK